MNKILNFGVRQQVACTVKRFLFIKHSSNECQKTLENSQTYYAYCGLFWLKRFYIAGLTGKHIAIIVRTCGNATMLPRVEISETTEAWPCAAFVRIRCQVTKISERLLKCEIARFVQTPVLFSLCVLTYLPLVSTVFEGVRFSLRR